MTKRLISVVFMLSLTLSLSSCSKEWKMTDSYEYHFYREEYDEQYRSYDIEFDLDKKEHKVQITSKCVSGTIIVDSNDQIEGFPCSVSSEDPLDMEFILPESIDKHISYTLEINEETEGSVVIKMYEK